MHRTSSLLPIAFVLLSLALPWERATLASIVYQGALQTSDSLSLPAGFTDNGALAVGAETGNPNQRWSGATIYWTVSNDPSEAGYNASYPWHYTYVFHRNVTGSGSNVSTLLIEALGGFLVSPSEVSPSGLLQQTALNGATINGTKITKLPGALDSITTTIPNNPTVTLQFRTPWEPVWGDFYAQDGTDGNPSQTRGYAYNAGFTGSDVDPVAPAASGSVQNHILVPGRAPLAVPEPASLTTFLGIGVPAMLLLSRQHRRRKASTARVSQ